MFRDQHHAGLTHITPICITLYLLTFRFGYKFFHPVSQCCSLSTLSAVGIHFCDLKITVSTSFLISLYASFSKSFVNSMLEIQLASEKLLQSLFDQEQINSLGSQQDEGVSPTHVHFTGLSWNICE